MKYSSWLYKSSGPSHCWWYKLLKDCADSTKFPCFSLHIWMIFLLTFVSGKIEAKTLVMCDAHDWSAKHLINFETPNNHLSQIIWVQCSLNKDHWYLKIILSTMLSMRLVLYFLWYKCSVPREMLKLHWSLIKLSFEYVSVCLVPLTLCHPHISECKYCSNLYHIWSW